MPNTSQGPGNTGSETSIVPALGARGSQAAEQNPPASAGDTRDTGLIPGSGRSPGGGNGSPLQYSWLESPLDQGARWATVRGT